MCWMRASKLGERLRGLLWCRPLAPGEALWIERCSAVHTAGMSYAIDVVFVSGTGRVTRIVPALRPWRMAVCLRASDTVELRAGEVLRLGWRVGMVLRCGQE